MSNYCYQHCKVKRHIEVLGLSLNSNAGTTLNVCIISAAPFVSLTNRIRKSLEGYKVFAASLKDIEKALEPKRTINPQEKLPREYHDFLDVFSKQGAD